MTDLSSRLSGIRKLQSGGEATVYKALLDGRIPVALKVYADGKNSAMENEAAFDGKIPGTVRLLGTGALGGRCFFVSEYVRGVSSAAVSPMPPKTAIRLLRRVLETLSRMAAKNVFHGDLNPENVLVSAEGTPVVVDFGIDGLGAPRFAAPERLEGSTATVRSEIFSLGALLYFWISGEPLFGGETFDGIEASVFRVDSLDVAMLLHGRGVLKPEELSAFRGVWAGTLRKDPTERCEDFDELDERLEIAERFLDGGSSAKGPQDAQWVHELGERIREREAEIAMSPEERWEISGKEPFFGTKCSKTRLFPLKIFLAVLVLLCGIFFFVYIGKGKFRNPDVETVGNTMLERSRSLMDEEPLGKRSASDIRGIMVDSDSSAF